jgi:tRNA threonylcarbamoyladenosine biosynthesis protein TsaB
MKLLAVETATGRLSVAILDGKQVLGRLDEDARGAHARWLVPAIDRLLKSTDVTLSAMEGLAVSVGPGSFTGLRVGLATVLGFRAVTGLPLAAVPTLEALAWNLHGAAQPLCPILKARTGRVYWALYQWTRAGTLQQVIEERVSPLEAVVRSIQGSTIMFGEGWDLYREQFLDLLGTRSGAAGEAPYEARTASAVSVSLAGLERLRRGEVAGKGLSPRYVQQAEAELALDSQKVVASGGAGSDDQSSAINQ